MNEFVVRPASTTPEPENPLNKFTSEDETAVLWQGDVPVSTHFQDVYYSRENGLAESRFVFLQHNRLEERWRLLEDAPGVNFCIAETGFGTGLNFLATWQLWSRFNFRHATLQFVSIEKYPLNADTLARAHLAWPELKIYSSQLCALLPPCYPGIHRRYFTEARIVLTLLHGDAETLLNRTELRANAWFLDGFSPTLNPDLWSPSLFKAMATASSPAATLATYTCAGQVRRSLNAAGFLVKKTRGFGWKRTMLSGERRPSDNADRTDNAAQHSASAYRYSVDQKPWFLPAAELSTPRRVLVIGGGLAGCATAWSLARRGLQVTLLEQAPQLASAASGNPVGLTFVRLTAHDSAQNRYYLNAYLHALGVLRSIFDDAEIPEGEHWRLNGILRVFDNVEEAQEIAAFLKTAHADVLARPLSAQELTAMAGFPIDKPGLLQPGSGWLNPATLCRALVRHPLIHVETNTAITAIAPGSSATWQACSVNQSFHADAIVIANSAAASQFPQSKHLTLRTVRGQITRLSATPDSSRLKHALNYSGYLTPVWNGYHTIGATFHPKRNDLQETQQDHQENIDRLRHALPHCPALPAESNGHHGGRVALRAGTPDYLPYVGPLPDADAYAVCFQEGLGKGQLKRLYPAGPLHPHLYVNVGHGSRGITSSLLAAEVICHWMLAEPAPVDSEILHSLHPARFLVRQFKRRST